jgi:hypothetical protein
VPAKAVLDASTPAAAITVNIVLIMSLLISSQRPFALDSPPFNGRHGAALTMPRQCVCNNPVHGVPTEPPGYTPQRENVSVAFDPRCKPHADVVD